MDKDQTTAAVNSSPFLAVLGRKRHRRLSAGNGGRPVWRPDECHSESFQSCWLRFVCSPRSCWSSNWAGSESTLQRGIQGHGDRAGGDAVRVFERRDSGFSGGGSTASHPETCLFRGLCLLGWVHRYAGDSASFPMQPAIRRSHLRFSTRWRFHCVEAQLQVSTATQCNVGAQRQDEVDGTGKGRSRARIAARSEAHSVLCAVFGRHWMAPRRNRQQLSSPAGWGARSTLCQPYTVCAPPAGQGKGAAPDGVETSLTLTTGPCLWLADRLAGPERNEAGRWRGPSAGGAS